MKNTKKRMKNTKKRMNDTVKQSNDQSRTDNNREVGKAIHRAAAKGDSLCGAYCSLAMLGSPFGIERLVDLGDDYDADDDRPF